MSFDRYSDVLSLRDEIRVKEIREARLDLFPYLGGHLVHCHFCPVLGQNFGRRIPPFSQSFKPVCCRARSIQVMCCTKRKGKTGCMPPTFGLLPVLSQKAKSITLHVGLQRDDNDAFMSVFREVVVGTVARPLLAAVVEQRHGASSPVS